MGGATPPRSSESFILVGTSTTAHENGRSVSLRSLGGRRGISCLVVAVPCDSSPPSAGAGMTKWVAEGWQFYFRSNDRMEPGHITGCSTAAVHSKSQ